MFRTTNVNNSAHVGNANNGIVGVGARWTRGLGGTFDDDQHVDVGVRVLNVVDINCVIISVGIGGVTRFFLWNAWGLFINGIGHRGYHNFALCIIYEARGGIGLFKCGIETGRTDHFTSFVGPMVGNVDQSWNVAIE